MIMQVDTEFHLFKKLMREVYHGGLSWAESQLAMSNRAVLFWIFSKREVPRLRESLNQINWMMGTYHNWMIPFTAFIT